MLLQRLGSQLPAVAVSHSERRGKNQGIRLDVTADARSPRRHQNPQHSKVQAAPTSDPGSAERRQLDVRSAEVGKEALLIAGIGVNEGFALRVIRKDLWASHQAAHGTLLDGQLQRHASRATCSGFGSVY